MLGSGAIGMLATCLLRLDGFAVWTAARAAPDTPKAQLADALGATYASVAETPPEALAQDVGGFDVVLEATGDAEVMLGTLGLLARNGVACLLGLDARPGRVALERRVVGVDAVLGNRALVGSVNAHRDDWVAAVAALARGARAVARRARGLRRAAGAGRPLRGRVRLPGREGHPRVRRIVTTP